MQKINLPKELMDKVRERLAAVLAERLGNRAVKSTYATKDDLCKVIDAAASETDTSPSDEQKEAGNYRKGKFRLHGLEIAIENPRGSERRGKDKNGTPWSITMQSHYGYIKKHISEADGDHVDVFIGPHPESQYVAVIDQVVGGKFDEHKVMIGFRNAAEAKTAYLASYTPGWKGFRALTPMTMNQFTAWLEKGDTSKPAAEQPIHYARLKSGKGQADLFADTDAVETKGGMEKGKWTQTQLGTQEFEKKHPRDQYGQFRKKVGQANLMLWGADGEPTPESQGAPQQSGKISTREPITHDINVDAREAAAHAFHKALHAAGKIAEPPKHPAPANIDEMKKAAGFGDGEGLVLFRHGDTLRAHGSDAQRFAEVNGGKDSAPASSLEQIGKALAARGHKLAIASRPEAKKQEQPSLFDKADPAAAPSTPAAPPKPAAPPEPPKTPAQEVGAKTGQAIAAKIEAKPVAPKSPLSQFMPGKNSDYPKPDPIVPTAPPAAAAPAAPKPAPLAPPTAVSLPPAPKKQPPRPEPSAMPKTEAELEREQRAAMELARPDPGVANPAKPAKDKTPKNNIGREEFQQKMQENQRLIAGMARKAGITDPDEVDEAIQNTGLQAWKGLHSFDPAKGVSFSTWLGQIATNAVNQVRRGNKTLKRGAGKKNVSLSQESGESSEAGKTATLADTVADYRENYDPAEQEQYINRIADASSVIGRLPARQQEIIKKYFLEGKTSLAIANELDVSGQAIRKQKDLAIAAIRRAMEVDQSGNEVAAAPSLFDKLPKKYRRDAENMNFIRLLTEAIRHKYLKAG